MDKKRKILKILKITALVFYILVTAVLLMFLIPNLPVMLGEKDLGAALGGAILMIVSLIVSAVYLIPIGIGIGGLIASRNFEGDEKKKNRLHFTLFINIPLITAFLNFLAYFLALST